MDDIVKKQIISIFERVRSQSLRVISEVDGLKILQLLGISVPRYFFIKDTTELDSIDISGWSQAVVKVVSPLILHKTDVGGVKVVNPLKSDILKAINNMQLELQEFELKGFLVCEFIPYSKELGSELLFGFRQTHDFGGVLTIGAGGIHTEFIASKFKEDYNVCFVPISLYDTHYLNSVIDQVGVLDLILKSQRKQRPLIDRAQLIDVITKLLEFSKLAEEYDVEEFEINPCVVYDHNLYGLDILIKLYTSGTARYNILDSSSNKPINKIQNLLLPESAAIIGVSVRLMNVGRIILNNFIERGFPKNNIYIIKKGVASIEGCQCVDDIEDLPVCVDLLVLAIPAIDVPNVIEKVITYQKAQSLIVIPGGLEEKAGSDIIVRKMHESLKNSRKSAWQGPVINGGNCLGIISKPGRYDTMFIPKYKSLEISSDATTPMAFISQSGAFAISRLNKFVNISPKYTITIGNQMDLCMSDYLEFLSQDSEIKIYALYIEGFKPLDGIRVLQQASALVKKDKVVILYCAGRTTEGAKAMASHTASIAGDYSLIKKIFEAHGVIVAQSFEDFEDYVKIFSCLYEYPVSAHKRVGVISNAGCECVAASDNLGSLTLSKFTKFTQDKLDQIFVQAKIDSIVDLHNPIDLTPMSNDCVYEAVCKAVLDDDNTDCAIISCVPLTQAINALPKSSKHNENYLDPSSIAQRLINLKSFTKKPWVTVVDAGALYDPICRYLESYSIPVFRTIDRALKIFNVFCLVRGQKDEIVY